MSLLTPEIKSWIGRSEPPMTAEVSRREIIKYAIATEQVRPAYRDGDEAPPMFVFGLFRPLVPMDTLGPDGLAPTAAMPELPLKRIMAGGTKMIIHRPIRPGQTLIGTRTLTDIFDKEGRQGPLNLLGQRTAHHHRGRRVGDGRDSNPDREVTAMPQLNDLEVGQPLPGRTYAPTNVSLFLYNAAIWNPHRIHYDENYATDVEHHPGVVVDGPLQGDWLAQVVTNWLGDDGALVEFEYSNRKAAYLGQTLVTGGEIETVDAASGRVTLALFVKDEAGDVTSPGSAVVRLG